MDEARSPQSSTPFVPDVAGAHMGRHRTDLEREILGLVDLAYASATEPTRWMDFLARLRKATGSRGASLTIQDLKARGGWTPYFEGDGYEVAAADYATWAASNVYLLRGAPFLRTGVVLRGEDVVEDRVVTRTEFYNEYMRRHDIHHHTGACVFLEESVTALLFAHRRIGKPSHSDAEKRLLEILVPHLQRAIVVQRKLEGLELERLTRADALDRLTVGVCLFDSAARPTLVNARARVVFDQGDGLVLGKHGLRAASAADDRRLNGLLSAACRGQVIPANGEQMPAAAMKIARPSGRRAFVVLVAPLRLKSFSLLREAPAALALIADPEAEPVSLAHIAARLFGLTPSEARVLGALLETASVAEIADRLGITQDTARTHLKRVFSKTGTRGQAELARVISNGPGRVGTATQIPPKTAACQRIGTTIDHRRDR